MNRSLLKNMIRPLLAGTGAAVLCAVRRTWRRTAQARLGNPKAQACARSAGSVADSASGAARRWAD